MEGVTTFAQSGGYYGLYIPTVPVIHSNHHDIQELLQKAGYAFKTIPEVQWSRQMRYPFTDVYAVWKKDN